MGLDMYLRKNGEDVVQWRKANAVHNWFAVNVDPGAMESMNPVQVSRADLIQLVNDCEEDLENYRACHKDNREYEPMHLIPTAGFFFGSTEVNGLWESDLEQTVQEIGRLLKEDDGDQTYEYMSWW